ncbi:MAG: amidohydrolase family protein [Myxococcota bacterium]
MGIARALHGTHGVLQAVSDFDVHRGIGRFREEFALLAAMAEASGGRPMSMTVLQRDQAPGQHKMVLEEITALNDRGVVAEGAGGAPGHRRAARPRGDVPPVRGLPELPRAGAPAARRRVARLRDPACKARMLSETTTPVAGDGPAIPRYADRLLAAMDVVSMRVFRLGDPPDYEQPFERSLFAEAQRTGVRPLEAMYDALLEDDGRALLYFPLLNYTGMDLSAVREMMAHPHALPGLSDGGAHVGTICDASFPTFLLSYWGRDRAQGRFPLPWLVRQQARQTARHLGLDDRGEVAVGQRADLNVIDFDRLGVGRPEVVADLPAGGRRLLQAPTGYLATLVAGVPVREHGAWTGATPGRVVRRFGPTSR